MGWPLPRLWMPSSSWCPPPRLPSLSWFEGRVALRTGMGGKWGVGWAKQVIPNFLLRYRPVSSH